MLIVVRAADVDTSKNVQIGRDLNGANHVTVGPTSAHVRNGSNGCFIRLDLPVDKRLSLTWTYEMLY
jgi:hypothetical protein